MVGIHGIGLHANTIVMPAAFIEHRPHTTSEHEPTSHYVIVIDGTDHGQYSTQKEARDAACAKGYRPVHVARVRHLPDKRNPAHWEVYHC
jgi:hypothetical protein